MRGGGRGARPGPGRGCAMGAGAGRGAGAGGRAARGAGAGPVGEAGVYFAYGANLSPAVLRRRGLVAAPESGQPAVCRGRRLCFDHRAGYGNLVEGAGGGGGAHGVVYRLGDEDWARLAEAEDGYCLDSVDVRTYDGEALTARAFVSDPALRIITTNPDALRPTERYLALLREGAEFHGLDEAYSGWLAGLEAVTAVPAFYHDTPRARVVRTGGLALLTLATAAVALASARATPAPPTRPTTSPLAPKVKRHHHAHA